MDQEKEFLEDEKDYENIYKLIQRVTEIVKRSSNDHTQPNIEKT